MKKYIITCLLLSILNLACQKDFLDEKPIKSLLVPKTAADFQALLDNYNDVIGITPSLQILAGDEIYLSQTILKGSSSIISNTYLWQKDLFTGSTVLDWNYPYQQIFYANVVIDGLEKNNEINVKEKNELKGQAHFIRAYAFFQLSQLFSDPYDAKREIELLGLPIPLSPDVNIRSKRGTQKQLYGQIIGDLIVAEKLLDRPKVITRASKSAVYALLARIYLVMNDFDTSKKYAAACLEINSSLLDYNTINATSNRPFSIPFNTPNPEIIYYSIGVNGYSFVTSSTTLIDPRIVSLYNNDDLRKNLFLRMTGVNTYIFKGNYTGSSAYFTGIATDEVYLIMAECQIRTDEVIQGMETLNLLLQHRYANRKFVPLVATQKENALNFVLDERKKELLLRGLRWSDLRRLNTETENAQTLTRENLTNSYSLAPNSKLYVFPIPDKEIANNPMEQNDR